MVYGAGDLAEEGAYLIVTGAVQLLSPAAPSKRKKIGGTSGGTSARAKHVMAEAGLEKELGGGDVFGESSAFGSTRRFDEAVARKTSEVTHDLGAGSAMRAGPGAALAVDRFTADRGTRDKMHPRPAAAHDCVEGVTFAGAARGGLECTGRALRGLDPHIATS